MSENPYESPAIAPEATGVLSGRREDLRSVAVYQKGILVCILLYILALPFGFLVPEQLQLLWYIGIVLVNLVGLVFVFLLAMKVYGVGVGILLGILALMPCINLIVLLIVNIKATSILRENGVRVGLMGADMSQL